MKKISNLLMMALLTVGMGLTSCDEQLDNAVTPSGVTPVVDEKGEVTSITVDLSKIDEKYLDTEKTKLQLTVGDVVTLSFTILPEEAADTKVELTAGDATILSIDGLKVTVLKEGETKVTAKAGDKTAEIPVTVKAAEIPVTGVTLDKTALAMTIGDADVQLNVTVTPANATNADVDSSPPRLAARLPLAPSPCRRRLPPSALRQQPSTRRLATLPSKTHRPLRATAPWNPIAPAIPTWLPSLPMAR